MDGQKTMSDVRRAATGWIVPMGVVAAFVALVSGCATPGTASSVAVAQQRCEALHAEPGLDPLRGRMPLPIVLGQALPVEQLADRRRVATEAERDAIKALEGVRADCRRLAQTALGPMPRFRDESEDRISEALADLYAGSISWGQFNKTLLHIGERDRSARESLDRELAARERWRTFHDFGGN